MIPQNYKILAIETSCDETSVALIKKESENVYKILSHETISQMNLHREFGGVYPTLSRREHEKNLVPLLHKVLKDGNCLTSREISLGGNFEIEKLLGSDLELLERYEVLKENLFDFLDKYDVKDVDYIAVTNGPGLPPALWVGVNFAKIISISFGNLPIFPINHMEGHIIGALSKINNKIVTIEKVKYPVLNFLISGGHTEFVLSDKNLSYRKIGETMDDAVGECFDKVARLLGLPYPGGPEVGKLAKFGRENGYVGKLKFPRPMLHSQDLNFSFSGLKTHILYFIRDYLKDNQFEILDENIKIAIATEFEETVADLFRKKILKAFEIYSFKTLVVGGGVASSAFIKECLYKLAKENLFEIYISEKDLATDNALMIALTCANQIENGISSNKDFLAIGSKKFEW